MLAERLMRHQASGERQVRTSDNQGGWIGTWTPIAQDVPAKLDPSDRGEELVAEQERAAATMRLFLPVATDVRRDDRWTITGDDLPAGGITVTIRVVEYPGGVAFTDAGGQLRCIVEQIQHGATIDEGS